MLGAPNRHHILTSLIPKLRGADAFGLENQLRSSLLPIIEPSLRTLLYPLGSIEIRVPPGYVWWINGRQETMTCPP